MYDVWIAGTVSNERWRIHVNTRYWISANTSTRKVNAYISAKNNVKRHVPLTWKQGGNHLARFLEANLNPSKELNLSKRKVSLGKIQPKTTRSLIFHVKYFRICIDIPFILISRYIFILFSLEQTQNVIKIIVIFKNNRVRIRYVFREIFFSIENKNWQFSSRKKILERGKRADVSHSAGVSCSGFRGRVLSLLDRLHCSLSLMTLIKRTAT